jgi:hypothetical protein
MKSVGAAGVGLSGVAALMEKEQSKGNVGAMQCSFCAGLTAKTEFGNR